MTKSGSVNTDIIGRKEWQLHMTIKGILISQCYRQEHHPPNQIQSPKRCRQYTPPKHNNLPLQYNIKAQKRPSSEKSL
jgi:hypothetical protein